MRDKRFIAKHRGGPLLPAQHRQLIEWACDCAEHTLPLFGDPVDECLTDALQVAREWSQGKRTTGAAMKASVAAHAVAREASEPVSVAVVRAVGQAVATAHMADHALGSAFYALKAIKLAGKPAITEHEWQIGRLPTEIKELVLSAFEGKKFKPAMKKLGVSA